jgi:hypothetical protein
MNWPTIKEKIEAGMDTVIICTASEREGLKKKLNTK